MNYIIYKVTFPNNKIYIGITKNSLVVRKAKHYSEAKKKGRFPFHKALNKYKRLDIKWEIIDYCSELEINFLEKYYIKFFESLINQNGYNVCLGGNINENFKGDGSAFKKFHKDNPKFISKMKTIWWKNLENKNSMKNNLKNLSLLGNLVNRKKVVIIKDCSIIEFDSINEAAKYIGVKSYIISKYFSGKLKHVRNYQIYKI